MFKLKNRGKRPRPFAYLLPSGLYRRLRNCTVSAFARRLYCRWGISPRPEEFSVFTVSACATALSNAANYFIITVIKHICKHFLAFDKKILYAEENPHIYAQPLHNRTAKHKEVPDEVRRLSFQKEWYRPKRIYNAAAQNTRKQHGADEHMRN